MCVCVRAPVLPGPGLRFCCTFAGLCGMSAGVHVNLPSHPDCCEARIKGQAERTRGAESHGQNLLCIQEILQFMISAWFHIINAFGMLLVA